MICEEFGPFTKIIKDSDYLWKQVESRIIRKKNVMNQFKSTIYGDGWLGIIFNGRNKSYGAYQLRVHSGEILFRAFLISVVGLVALFMMPSAYRALFPTVAADPILSMQTIKIYTILNPVTPVVPIPKSPTTQEIKAVKTLRTASQPVVVPDVRVDIAAIESLKNETVVGPISQEGIVAPAGMIGGLGNTGGVASGNHEGAGQVYESVVVQNYPEFIGGMAAWAKFVQRNLRYPADALDRGIQGKVYISFVIEKDGSIGDVTVLKGIGGGCDEEAVRVIKSSPKWKPARQGNETVRVRYNMPIGFSLF